MTGVVLPVLWKGGNTGGSAFS